MHTTSEMALCIPAISIIFWKVKYPLCFVVSYISNQELFEKYLCIRHTKRKTPQLYQLLTEKWSTHYALLSAMFNPLHSSTNLCNQNSHHEKYRQFLLQRKSSRATTKLTLFAVRKDELDTEENTGKSMKNALYVLCSGMSKGTSRAKVTLNSEKIKPIALAIIELCLSEGISQSVTQPVENLNYIYI